MTTDAVLIRPATPADLGPLHALVQRAYRGEKRENPQQRGGPGSRIDHIRHGHPSPALREEWDGAFEKQGRPSLRPC